MFFQNIFQCSQFHDLFKDVKSDRGSLQVMSSSKREGDKNMKIR